MKSTADEIRRRINALLEIRLAGAQFHEICKYAATTPEEDDGSGRPWNVSQHQLRRYVARADRQLRRQTDEKRDTLISRHIAMRQLLYSRSLDAGDFRTALAVAADEAKLRGLYPEPKPTTPTVNVGVALNGVTAKDVAAELILSGDWRKVEYECEPTSSES